MSGKKLRGGRLDRHQLLIYKQRIVYFSCIYSEPINSTIKPYFGVRQQYPIVLWGLNPHHWLSAFLQACADHGGQSPADLSAFVPWQMSAERRQELSRPLPVIWPAFERPAQEREEPEPAHAS
jgi:hypothetical protein